MANKIVKKILLEAGYVFCRGFNPPEFVSLLITYQCNFKCESCDIWKKNVEELSEEKWLEIAAALKKYFPRETFIEINGGEPLLRKELALNLIKSLKEKFNQVGINSNGYLINNESAEEIKKTGADFVKISLYSLTPEIHDQMRGFSGAYQTAVRAINVLLKNGIKTEAAILITRKNIAEIPALIKKLKELGENLSFILQPLDETIEGGGIMDWENNFIEDNLWPGKEETEKLFEELKKHSRWIKNWPRQKIIRQYYLNPKSVLKNRCFAGQRNLVVFPEGEISFCFKGRKLGGLGESNFENIFKSKKAGEERRRIKKCRKYCRIIGCNYSRGLREFLDLKH